MSQTNPTSKTVIEDAPQELLTSLDAAWLVFLRQDGATRTAWDAFVAAWHARDAEAARLRNELEEMRSERELCYDKYIEHRAERDRLRAALDAAQKQLGALAVLILQNDRDETLEWARGVRVTFPNGEPTVAVESPVETAEKRAYYETHDPPHCPTCGCGANHETRGESAWLIEMTGEAQPLYWHAVADMRVIGGFDPDPEKAIRFCRQKDAREMALMLGVKGMIAMTEVRRVRITEHEWPPEKAKGDCAHRWAPTIAGDQRMCIDCGARRPAQKANDSPTSTGE